MDACTERVCSSHYSSNRFLNSFSYSCIVSCDGKYLSIASASVLAKTYRDDFMLRIDKEYPQYLWAQNKGYPTIAHREAILAWVPRRITGLLSGYFPRNLNSISDFWHFNY